MSSDTDAIAAQIMIREAVLKAAKLPWIREDIMRLHVVLDTISADLLVSMCAAMGDAEDPAARAKAARVAGKDMRGAVLDAFARYDEGQAERSTKQ